MAAISNFVSFSNLKLQIGWWQHLGGINLVGLANTCCNSPVQLTIYRVLSLTARRRVSSFFFNCDFRLSLLSSVQLAADVFI